MRLAKSNLAMIDKWNEMNIKLPTFDLDRVKENTRKIPQWVHFGAGNIFRGFIANAHQKVLDMGLAETGIIAVDSFDFEVIERVYKPYDNLSLLVLMNASGRFDKKVVASVVDSVAADYSEEGAMEKLVGIFESESLQMASFTITEKGYVLKAPNGEYFGVVARDIKNGPEAPLHTMGMVAGFLYRRYKKNAAPMTLVSMDNCSLNGDKLKNGVLTMAEEWLDKGFVDQGFVDYLLDETRITFPISMIDKITPRPSDTVKKHLEDLGMDEMDTIVTSKNSYMAPFVNAEISEYLVIEDKFTNGRPRLEEAGIIFTDRETVNKVETMKVTTCLNPLHTALAVAGCLLGHTLIAEEMKDPGLRGLVKAIGYEEGLRVVVNPGIVDPKSFIDEVVNERFANPHIPDTPQRIATDTSQKVGVRYGETIKSYAEGDKLDPSGLEAIPMAIALWCRYLLAIDDEGKEFALSPDPLMETLRDQVSEIGFGQGRGELLEPILSNKTIFGLDLYQVGLGEKIEDMFNRLNAGRGSIRKTLNEMFVQE